MAVASRSDELVAAARPLLRMVIFPLNVMLSSIAPRMAIYIPVATAKGTTIRISLLTDTLLKKNKKSGIMTMKVIACSFVSKAMKNNRTLDTR